MLIPNTDFPVRPSIEKGESLAGYICRFHGINGHRVPPALYQVLQALYHGTPGKAAAAFNIVQSVVGDSVALDRTWWLGGTLIEKHSRAWQTLACRPARFCPDCLSEYGFHFTLWELPLVQACPLHKRVLLTECSLCQKTLSWSGISPAWSCRCGKSIATMPAEPANQGAVAIARLFAGSDDIELSDSFQKCFGKPTYGSYCLSDIYAGLEWVSELRNIFLKRSTNFGELPYRRRRLTRRSWPSVLEVRLLADSPEQVVHCLLRVLIKRIRKNNFMLYLVPEFDGLNQAILFTNGEDSSIFQKKIRTAVEHILSEYSVELPISSVVLYNPRFHSERRIVYLTQFMIWWDTLSRHIGELDPEIQNNQRTTSSQSKMFGMPIWEMEIVKVLNFLLDAALQQVDVGDFRAFSYWWRIPRELCALTKPSEVLSQIGSHLVVIPDYEIYFVGSLVRLARIGKQ